jgi:hypothetical protein
MAVIERPTGLHAWVVGIILAPGLLWAGPGAAATTTGTQAVTQISPVLAVPTTAPDLTTTPPPRRRGGLIHPSQRTPEEQRRIDDFRRRIDAQAEQIRKGGLTTTGTLTSNPMSDGSSTTTAEQGPQSRQPAHSENAIVQ